MATRIPVLVIGGTGRLGAAVVDGCRVDSHLAAVGTVGRSSKTPFSDVPHFTDLTRALDALNPRVVLDAAPGKGLAERLECMAAAPAAVVIGTTGYDAAARSAIEALARDHATVLAVNFSPGVVVLEEVLRVVGSGVAEGLWEASILERHHRKKVDRPSGTAKHLARVLEKASAPCEIVSLRQGDVAGEHHVFLSRAGEELVFTHRATDRKVFADGALLAVQFAARAVPGLWSMRDVLGMSDARNP